ncbi:hypothetical protein F4821DRAFT_16498 [Hypoxylon rubiginosum]|uniref:Uncharacterized protein n=1 Tax=Hypoxylon rubiginosum TaxID=110542 RepID=A0ACC0CNG9_9PEZI|nr:hypothetical protein F4821DRAFT_16498 [Hypoxylon rubiginosum]
MKPTDPNHPCLTIWFSITIPAYLSAGKDQTRVAMQLNSLTHTRFTFKMKVGKPGKQQMERFEWRMSKGYEVHHIHPKAHGAKLVRLGHEGPGGGAGGERGTRKKGESSDGKEVVAVWGTTSHVPRTVTGEYKKPFTLYFRGSGDTGELGEEFRALAIMSALKIFQLTEQKM